MRKAILLMTVCRRYHELGKNLTTCLERATAELGYQPEVALVWARPEICRLWFMRELTESGKITYIVSRQALPDESDGCSTTYPESYSIRQGLEFIRSHYKPEDHYVIFQAADISMKEGTLGFINHHMGENEAVVFHWQNGCANSDIWHTNCFGVSLDTRYWPPISSAQEQDVLERQWGKSLANQKLEGIHRWHNYGSKRFAHEHESENMPLFPLRAEKDLAKLYFNIKGHRVWYLRFLDWCKNLLRRA